MRSSPLVLVLLIGVQAALNMGGGLALSAGAANHRAGQRAVANHRAGQQQQAAAAAAGHHLPSQDRHRSSHQRTKQPQRAASHQHSPAPGPPRSDSVPDPSVPVVDPKLFSKRRYRSSPRVVFSELPPSHDVLEAGGFESEGRGLRVRRRAGAHTMHRGEYSVCDSINTWVGNMTRAMDIAGREVTVLPHVTINNVVKRQFFYETTCRSPTDRGSGGGGAGRAAGGRGAKPGAKPGNSGCLGIDSRHWNSYCTNTHIYISALTMYEGRPAWRFIRINAACVCVLSRKSWAGRLGH